MYNTFSIIHWQELTNVCSYQSLNCDVASWRLHCSKSVHSIRISTSLCETLNTDTLGNFRYWTSFVTFLNPLFGSLLPLCHELFFVYPLNALYIKTLKILIFTQSNSKNKYKAFLLSDFEPSSTMRNIGEQEC